jgi:hypothetical protein
MVVSPAGHSDARIRAHDRAGWTLLMVLESNRRLGRVNSFGSSYSLHTQQLADPTAGSGVQLRSLQDGWLQDSFDWLTVVLAANVDWFLPRLDLARMEIWADSARPCQSTEAIRAIVPPSSHHVPCRLPAWYLWRSLLALIRSISLRLLASAGARMSGVNWHQTFSMSPCQYLLPIMTTPSLYSYEHRLGS